MPSSRPELTVVLGHARVLEEHDGDPRLRVTARRGGGRAVGVAAMERLYGPAAEVAVAVEDPADRSLVSELVSELRSRARDNEIDTLRIVVDHGQRALAETLGPVAGDAVELRS